MGEADHNEDSQESTLCHTPSHSPVFNAHPTSRPDHERSALFELLDIAGSITIIDAMGTQTAIASQIFNAKADYVLAFKGNHPTLYGQVKNWFEQQFSQGFKGISIVMING